MNQVKNIFLVLLFFSSYILFVGCKTERKLAYFQDKDTLAHVYKMDTSYDAIIQSNDILSIFVASISEEANKYFNFSGQADVGGSSGNGYLVDHDGNIQLALVGNVKVAGLTSKAARDTVRARLEKYLKDPSVKLNIKDFRVTVLGEVNKPGVIVSQNERITLPQAIAQAGDLTIFGRRDNILIIREVKGKKEFYTIDITSREILASPFYLLHANDIIYVEADKVKVSGNDPIFRILPLVFAGISTVLIVMRYLQL